MKRSKHQFLVLFPYLYVSEKLEFGDLVIRPATMGEIGQENADIQELAQIVRKFFRVDQNQPIGYWSYTTSELASPNEFETLREKLLKLSDLLRFAEFSKLDSHFTFGNFNFFTIDVTNIKATRTDNFCYIETYLNGIDLIDFDVSGDELSRMYHPALHTSAAIVRPENLKENSFWKALHVDSGFFYQGPKEKARILHSIEWFNRSFAHVQRGVGHAEAVINMHIALEALLRASEEDRSVKAQIKSGLLTLLGQREELGKWFDSFYSLRNAIVHGDVKIPSYSYVHRGSTSGKGNKSHIYLSRTVFVECLSAILEVRKGFKLLGFEEELIPNDLRIHEALKGLKGKKLDVVQLEEKGVLSNLAKLRRDDLTSAKSQVITVARAFLPLVAADAATLSHLNGTAEIRSLIGEITTWKGRRKVSELGLKFSELERAYQAIYFKLDKTPSESKMLRIAAYEFISYAAWRLFTFFD